jgi:choline dehydrogenase-like flavoprotein
MHIEDLASLPDDRTLDADLVIIGAGMAGLTLARELAGGDLRVLMLESGILELDDRYRELNRVESRENAYFEPLGAFRRKYHSNNCPVWDPEIEPYGMRLRAFGGSSAYWGGKVATFERIDFAQRDWVPNSGWPLSYDELSPYFARAGEVLNLGPNVYDDGLWSLLGKPEFSPPIDPAKLRTIFWQFARSSVDKLDMVRFGKEYIKFSAPNVRVLINATVTRIDLDSGQSTFGGLEVATLDGQRRQVSAKTCVLAASAIENARLLLTSNHQLASGIGNQNDRVGRYLMDHPGAKIGHFKYADLGPVTRRFGFFGLRHQQQTHMYMHGLALSPEVQRSESLLQTALFMLEEVAPDDPFKALVRLLKRKSPNVGADVKAVASSLRLLIKGIGMKIFQSNLMPEPLKDFIINTAIRVNPNLVVREFQSIGMPHKMTGFEIHAISEQCPNPDSRIRLAESKDQFGVPRALAEWRPGERETTSIMRLAEIMSEAFVAAGLPRPELADWIVERRPDQARLIDMAHTLGTTRMSSDPKEGVVDTQCKIHGIEGIYLAGGSVMPTSGHANPTLMILSLAIRLADHLKAQGFGSQKGNSAAGPEKDNQDIKVAV